MGHPMSVLKAENIFDRVISIKYDVPNDRLEMFAQYHRDIDAFIRMFWKRMHKENRRSCQSNI